MEKNIDLLDTACIEIAKKLESYGVDLLNVNTGTYDSFYYCVSPYYMSYEYNIVDAKKVKAAVNISAFVAGQMDDPDLCEKAIADGDIDGMPFCSSNPSAMNDLDYGIPKAEVKKNVGVIGGGLTGRELAFELAHDGKEVTIVEAMDAILSSGPKVQMSVEMMLYDLLDEADVDIKTGYRISSVTDEGAVVTDKYGKDSIIEADNVIFAMGLRSKSSIAKDLFMNKS